MAECYPRGIAAQRARGDLVAGAWARSGRSHRGRDHRPDGTDPDDPGCADRPPRRARSGTHAPAERADAAARGARDQERMVALEHDNARLRDEVAALRAEGPARACRHSLAVLYSIHKLTGIVICRPYFAHTIASLTFAKCLLYMRMGLDAVEQLCYHARTRDAVARPVLVRVAASADHSGERPPGPSPGRHPRIWWARIRLYASLLD